MENKIRKDINREEIGPFYEIYRKKESRLKKDPQKVDSKVIG